MSCPVCGSKTLTDNLLKGCDATATNHTTSFHMEVGHRLILSFKSHVTLHQADEAL